MSFSGKLYFVCVFVALEIKKKEIQGVNGQTNQETTNGGGGDVEKWFQNDVKI